MTNKLFYGDNLEVLRRHVKDETVDLCYIDPPFNSKRSHFQIFNNLGGEDRALAQAFVDTWSWDDAAISGYQEIVVNGQGRFTSQLTDLVKGIYPVLGKGSLLAYLVSMSLRITEIHRVLKPTGSFYLHCDPTASHYLKVVIDSIFLAQGGDCKNEIIWHYRRWTGKAKNFQELHDTVFFYVKSKDYTFNPLYTPYTEGSKARKEQGVLHRFKAGEDPYLVSDGTTNELGVRENDVWQIPFIAPSAKERLGYPTQKPEALLEKIIRASSNEGDTVLDAYCGCGTTVAVSQRLKRHWLGIDITYQAIAVILKRMEEQFGSAVSKAISLNGIPRDMASARALALKQDDRLRKEFEKWAVLTYTSNRAVINQKKGADGGIDGVAYFQIGKEQSAKVVFQVKSGGVQRGDVAKLRGDMDNIGAEMAVLITLEDPTRPMLADAKGAGHFHHDAMGRNYDRIRVVTIKDMIENHARMDIPMSLDVIKAAQKDSSSQSQLHLL